MTNNNYGVFNLMFDFLSSIIMIIEGYSIWFWNIITGKTRAKAKARMAICNQCKYNHNGVCIKCGCVLKAKTRVHFIEDENGISIGGCPERKW